ncbi:MAG: hypothetical protein DHS20C18_31000 [Saprospiraceae bacterium]|nr:MAG: hypothetical protein DHS20C18_31000 [Saprospiraceae bacterium]
MDNQNQERSKHAETIIRNHVIFSMGASLVVVIPIADIFAVSAVQMDMVKQLCRVYDISFSETQGKAIVTTLTSSTLARAGARSLIKLVPGIGTVIGGVTTSVFNGASTYALGEVFKKHFESGGTILDFDPERLKKYYKEKFEKGKKMAEQYRKEEAAPKQETKSETAKTEEASKTTASPVAEPKNDQPTAAAVKDVDNVLEKLHELGDLKEKGIISEAEFEVMKKKLIGKF